MQKKAVAMFLAKCMNLQKWVEIILGHVQTDRNHTPIFHNLKEISHDIGYGLKLSRSKPSLLSIDDRPQCIIQYSPPHFHQCLSGKSVSLLVMGPSGIFSNNLLVLHPWNDMIYAILEKRGNKRKKKRGAIIIVFLLLLMYIVIC